MRRCTANCSARHERSLRTPGQALAHTVELPAREPHTVESCLRQLDLIDEEVAAIDRAIAERALSDVRIRRLMTIPGVDVVVAALVATIGEIDRFGNRRPNSTISQSGSEPAKHGRISKQGRSMTRRTARRSSLDQRTRPARCAPSTTASAPAAARRSPPSQPRASWPRSPGRCSITSRTAPTRGRR
jgi:transposase